MADVGFRHVTKVTLFRNGDPNFNGKHIVVNPRYYRNFESFLDTATFTTQCTSAVTRICTPLGRHNIESVDQLADGGTYVAVGRETFKRLKYGQPRPRKIPVRLPPIWRNHLPSSGRFRKVYEGERQALKRIFVYRNGDNITPARMILLKKRVLTDMELVLAALQESRLHFDFAISKLSTLNGRQIHDCDEIVHDGKYVAIERGSRFKSMKYGGHGEVSPRSIISHSFPPLAPQNNNSNVHRSPKKQITKLPTITKPRPPPPPTKQEKKVPSSQTEQTKKQRENKRADVPNQQSLVSMSQDENKESFSDVSLSATPPPLGESPDFTLSTANKDKENKTEDEKLPEIGEIPRDIDELPKEEQESIGAHIYKASGMQREWGDMVNDSRKTPGKTLDNTPAEEVVEEIVEDIEEVTEISETAKVKDEKGDKNDEGNKKGLKIDEENIEEIVQEVTETLVDKDEKDGREDNKKNEPVKQGRSDSETSRKNDDKSDEESEDEDDRDEESADDMASNDNDGDEAKVDDGKMQGSVAVDNDDKKVDGTDKTSSGTLVGNNENGDNKVHGDTDPVASDKDIDDDDDDEDDDEDKDESPAVSQNPSRRSSQEMNSEDEVKSEDEVDEDDDEKDDDDNKDGDDEDVKSEEEDESEDDKDEEEEDDDKEDDDDDDDDDSSVASEPEDNASDSDPTSEKEDETTEENAAKQNKTNQKVEEQRAQPGVSTKKGKPDMIKSRSTKTRDVNKA